MGDHGECDYEPEPCKECSDCGCDWMAGRTKHKRDCVLHYHDYDEQCSRCADTIVHYHPRDELCPGIFLQMNKRTPVGRDAVYNYPTSGTGGVCGDGRYFCCQAFDDAMERD